MNGHTPGPWGFDSEYGMVGSASQDAGRGDLVCLPPEAWCKESLARWPANARLISAAPELLSACMVAARYLDPRQFKDAVRAIDAAIAKATGAAP